MGASTKIVANVKKKTLMPSITDNDIPDSIVYADSLPSYNAFVIADLKHKQINHCKTFADGYNRTNGTKNFCNQATNDWAEYSDI